MKCILAIVMLLFSFNIFCQNFIANHDFEITSDCPDTLGQINLLDNWENIIIDSDYYNCGYTIPDFPSISLAYSGDGYVSFALTGNSNGSSEAIGQALNSPLFPNETYRLQLAGKKVSVGSYANICGGVAVYGFKEPEQLQNVNIHISQYNDAYQLGITEEVDNDNWLAFNLEIKPTDTIQYIVFTIEQVPNCWQCIFIDSLSLELDLISIAKEYENKSFNVYPNPFHSSINLNHDKRLILIEVYDELGRKVYSTTENRYELDTYHLKPGLYFLKCTDRNGDIYSEKIIKSQ